jgi:diaminopimelate decarboxylase
MTCSSTLETGVYWERDFKGEILIGGQALSRVVESVGGTPCYLYDRERIARRVGSLRAAFSPAVSIHYAIKANPMPALVCAVGRLVDGLDVASARELRVALDAGMAPAHISFAGPGKTDKELDQASAAGVLVNVESRRELHRLARASAVSGQAARVAVRVNLPFELRSSGMKMSGGARQFGIDAEEVPEILGTIWELGLAFEGFHLFGGAQALDARAIADMQARSYELALGWADLSPDPIRTINLGGGFGIPYTTTDRPLDLSLVAEQTNRLADRLQRDIPGAKLTLELGRYIVGEAGIYVCQVIDRKLSRGRVFLVADGGLHHHLAASGNFGQVIRRNYPVAMNHSSKDSELVSVVGPLCTPLDLIADKVELPAAEAGDLVVVFQSGAYGRTASPRDFLGHPEAIEALI